MVALVEKNNSGAFETICSAFDEKTYEDGYYTLNGIDYYTDANDEKIQMVQEHPYNVILMDFGCLTEENKDAFERCEDRLLIAGERPWKWRIQTEYFPWHPEMSWQNMCFALISCQHRSRKRYAMEWEPLIMYIFDIHRATV